VRDSTQEHIPDLVQRQFIADKANQLWVADMTYIPTWEGFVYLAIVLDVYSRKVVGWSFGEHMTAALVIQALDMATYLRQPKGGLIHHSDHGSQYTSTAFGKRCEYMGITRSMGSVGDAYDNAMAESFFASLECELINQHSFKTRIQAKSEVFTWIEAWYNPRRLHSALNYQSPNHFERSMEQSTKQENPLPSTVLPTACSAVMDKSLHGLNETSRATCPQPSTVDNTT
jgi:putative transposase